jgi:transcriptional regulator with XRE-family HTH domain
MNAVDELESLRLRPDPCVWDVPAVAEAVAARDITRVYRSLQKIGYSQQRIAALVGQSQPEVSAIMHGRRVMAYDVLVRIVEGLGIPRGRAGLGTCECQSGSAAASAPPGGVLTPAQAAELARPATEAMADGPVAEMPDPRLWWDISMMPLVMARDFAGVYRQLVVGHGFTVDRIAALTGQLPQEVLAVIGGARVREYDVIRVILDGLGIPRGLAGMSACWCWTYRAYYEEKLARWAAGEVVTDSDEWEEA